MATLRHQDAAVRSWNAFWIALDDKNAAAARAAFNAFPRNARINGFGINEMHDALCEFDFGR